MLMTNLEEESMMKTKGLTFFPRIEAQTRWVGGWGLCFRKVGYWGLLGKPHTGGAGVDAFQVVVNYELS